MTTASDRTPEEELVAFARQLTWAAIPADVQRAALHLSADAVGNAASGRHAEGRAELLAASHALFGDGGSPIVGGGRTSVAAAVGLNAFQATANTMCDVYRPALCHVTPEVVPAALAAAEIADVAGEELLVGIAVGLEITVRVCQALDYPVLRGRGWHTPGIAGTIGAAAAAGRILGLSEPDFLGCLGTAASQAAGTFSAIGTVDVKLHQLNGARAGIVAALLAVEGLLGTERALTAADGGLLSSYAGGGKPALLTSGIGAHWELTQIAMRPYPSASTLQSLINCLLSQEFSADFRAGEITAASIWLNDEGYRLGAATGWSTDLSSMQSARYVAAAVLQTGDCWTDLYRDELRHDRRITDFAEQHVDVQLDRSIPFGGVRVRVSARDGDVELRRDAAIGDPSLPMTTADVAKKVQRCLDDSSSEFTGRVDAQRLLELANERSVRELLADLALDDRRAA